MSRGRKIPESTRKKVLDAVRAGIRCSDIARSFKIGQTSVRRIAGSAGIKRSPEAPTAMENASEETKDSGSAADTNIIPEVPENVKQDDYSPYESAVDDAVLERIERLRYKIADLQLEMSNYESELNVLEEFHLKYMEAQKNERSNENC